LENPMRKRPLIILLLAGATFIFVEVALRKLWGFGTMLLFQADQDFEYIAQPNQSIVRFGKAISYNEYSMRSNPLSNRDTCIVLGFGDSVINGGTLTDQDSLATSIVESKLKGARFLNISAGSWAPDNCAAYLKKYGNFDAKMIILFVSSHDAHDNMTHENTVGVHPSYPDKQYPLAIIEVIDRYVIPRISKLSEPNGEENSLMINKGGVGFNSGFEFFNNYTKELGIPFLVCLHAEKVEVEEKKYNSQGVEILNFCEKNNIRVISGLAIGENSSHFIDGIHLNQKGQKLWSEALEKEIAETLKKHP
jgi:hypothetical protein